MATALLGGGGLGVFHEDFTDEATRDERRLALAAKVRCVADERCDQIFPHQFPAVLRVEMADGTRHEVRVDTNRGGPERPLSTDELATKVRLNASRVLDADAAAAVARAGLALPGAPGRLRPHGPGAGRRRRMSDGDPGHQRRLERLVEWGLGPDVLADDDVAHAVTLVTDTVAAVVAAGVEPEVRDLAAAAPSLGGAGAATVLATGVGTSPWAAALVNGTAAVRLELDEGNPFCGNHPSAHTLPAVLATAAGRRRRRPDPSRRVGGGLRGRRPGRPRGPAALRGAPVRHRHGLRGGARRGPAARTRRRRRPPAPSAWRPPSSPPRRSARPTRAPPSATR